MGKTKQNTPKSGELNLPKSVGLKEKDHFRGVTKMIAYKPLPVFKSGCASC